MGEDNVTSVRYLCRLLFPAIERDEDTGNEHRSSPRALYIELWIYRLSLCWSAERVLGAIWHFSGPHHILWFRGYGRSHQRVCARVHRHGGENTAVITDSYEDYNDERKRNLQRLEIKLVAIFTKHVSQSEIIRWQIMITCNIKLKTPNFVPCFIHKLSNYDAYFIVTELAMIRIRYRWDLIAKKNSYLFPNIS